MSTWLYLECRTHDPVLQDSDEVGQHLGQELEQVQVWLAQREGLIDLATKMRAAGFDPFETEDRYYRTTLRFVLEHPRCEIGIRDEYGRDHPVVPETNENEGA